MPREDQFVDEHTPFHFIFGYGLGYVLKDKKWIAIPLIPVLEFVGHKIVDKKAEITSKNAITDLGMAFLGLGLNYLLERR